MAQKRRRPASTPTDVLSLRIPTDLLRLLDERAQADDRSRNRTVVRLLREGLGQKAAG